MPRLLNRNPAYRKHRASGQAIVTIDNQDFYLGPWGTKASRNEYDRIVAEWLAGGRRLRPSVEDITVAELLAAYLNHAKAYYKNPDGTPGGELDRINRSIPLLSKLYGLTPVTKFSPLSLKAIRQKMIDSGTLARITVNQRINCIRRIFRWGVSEGMVTPVVLQGLEAIDGLRRGRSTARESESVKPVGEDIVLATIAHATPHIAAMAKLQLLTGMRPGEVCRMRTCDIDTSGKLWTYKPTAHKTAWHGHERIVYLSPKAQDVLAPFLKLDTQAFIFTPADSDAWRRQQLHLERKTPEGYGNNIGTNKKRRPAKQPGPYYVTESYRQAIDYAIAAAFPAPDALDDEARRKWNKDHHWHPHQLRHTAATMLRKEHGLEAAQVILGHKTLSVTQIYAEKNVEAAMKIMAVVG